MNNLKLVSKLKISNTNKKIEIFYDILENILYFYGYSKYNDLNWQLFSKKEIKVLKQNINFEQVCVEIYEEMVENEKKYNLIKSYFKDLDTIEIA